MRIIGGQSQGFTIVELVTAIAISGLFLGAVSTMLNNNARIAQKGRDAAVVNSYAENKIEEMRSTGYLGLDANGTPLDLTSELPSELKEPRSASLTITQETTSIKKAVLSITYSELGKPRSHTYATLIGELGVGQY